MTRPAARPADRHRADAGGHRQPPLVRGLGLLLRTGHLLSMAALAGGLLGGLPGADLTVALVATVATGAALLAIEASHGPGWLLQGRGLAVLGHVGAYATLVTLGLARAGAATALVVGALGSHMPKRLRHWSPLDRAGGG